MKIKLLKEECRPYKKHATDAGLDLRMNLEKPQMLMPNESIKIDTGIQVEITRTFLGLVTIRSSFGTKHNINLMNAPGIIDPDYRGNIYVKIHNYGKSGVLLEPYERFAQIIEMPCTPTIIYVEELDSTERGAGGFGSTGKE